MEKIKTRYYDSLMRYGYYSLLVIKEKREKEQRYEECQIINTVLEEHEKRFNIILPREINKTVTEDYKQDFNRLGYSGEVALGNVPFYVNEIESYLNK